MAIVEEGICKIVSLNSQGLGVGSSEMGPVELPYVLPGDVAEFERHSYRGKSNCILKNTLEQNASRAEAPCKYFGACGGCLLQHLPDQDYTAFKLSLLTTAIDAHKISTDIMPMITIPGGSRRRANMEAIKKNGQLFLGFHRFHSHQIINIDACLALDPELSSIIIPLKEALAKVMGDRQKLQLFITKASNGIDISIEIQKCEGLSQLQRAILAEFAQIHNITRLIFRYRKFIDAIHEKEKPYILFDNVPVEIDAYCFLQSSFKSDRVLSGLVVDYLKDAGSRAVDLFCGRGTYTVPLSRFMEIDGFESDKKSLTALGKAAPQLKLFHRDLFASPVLADDLAGYQACVINPPRAGAEAQCIELAKSKLQKICYISCNPQTFARDVNILAAGGYILKTVTPVDQFYWSPHLEVVGYFEKG